MQEKRSREAQRDLKPLGTRPAITYRSCKVDKKCADCYLTIRPILSALQTPTYKFAKFLVSILEPLTTNKYTIKDLLNFAIEIVEQASSNIVDSLDTPLEETIKICTNNLFKTSNIVNGLKKSE